MYQLLANPELLEAHLHVKAVPLHATIIIPVVSLTAGAKFAQFGGKIELIWLPFGLFDFVFLDQAYWEE